MNPSDIKKIIDGHNEALQLLGLRNEPVNIHEWHSDISGGINIDFTRHYEKYRQAIVVEFRCDFVRSQLDAHYLNEIRETVVRVFPLDDHIVDGFTSEGFSEFLWYTVQKAISEMYNSALAAIQLKELRWRNEKETL